MSTRLGTPRRTENDEKNKFPFSKAEHAFLKNVETPAPQKIWASRALAGDIIYHRILLKN